MKKIFRLGVFIFIFFLFIFLPQLSAVSELLPPNLEPTISMDFKDADLKDILKLFSIQSGLNFIASEAVEDRKITLYLDKVPLSKTMDRLFQANNLSYELDEEAGIFMVKDWGKPQIETITKVFYLKYATVSSSSLKEELSKQVSVGGGTTGGGTGKWAIEDDTGITKAVKKILSEHGSVIEDFRTNSLIVTDIPSRMSTIAKVIASLDVPVPQVMLEVEMLDVSKNTVDKLGISWPQSLARLTVTGTKMVGFPFKGQDASNWVIKPEAGVFGGPTSSSGWDFSDTGWIANKFGPNILTVLGNTLVLDFLRTQSDTKYLARPRILTLNNEVAEIKIVTNEAIGIKTTASSVGGAATTTTEEAERAETGVSLRVTPQINLGTGEITMFIVPTVSEATTGGTFTGSGGQSITFKDPEVRSTKSIVRVKDGETVIIGGLIRNESSETDTKVPILGNIPILGSLFRHKDKTKDKERELLVFITPHIIKDTNIELAQAKKVVPFLEREQNTLSVIDRQAVINSSLNRFEKKKK